jgi:hypothetical protein
VTGPFQIESERPRLLLRVCIEVFDETLERNGAMRFTDETIVRGFYDDARRECGSS